MRFKKKHNVMTGQDDYVLETKSERQVREGAEIAGGVLALLGLLVSGIVWLLGLLFRGVAHAARKLPEDSGGRTEKAMLRGLGVVAYVVLALLAFPFVVGLVTMPAAHYLGIPFEYLFLPGTVVYVVLAVRVIKKRLARARMEEVGVKT